MTISRYHAELRYQLDMADVRLSQAVRYDNNVDIRAAMAWRHMLIVELNRVQNEEWNHA